MQRMQAAAEHLCSTNHMHASHAGFMAYLCVSQVFNIVAAGPHCFEVVHIVLDFELALGGAPLGVGLMVGQGGRIHQVARVLQQPLHPRRRILHMLQQISVC